MASLRCEKPLTTPLQPHLVTLCPTLDLVAIVAERKRLEVYRISGQRAFAHQRSGDLVSKIQGLVWQPDDSHIALAWDDGVIEVINVELGKVEHELDVRSPGDATTTNTLNSLSWSTHHFEVSGKTRLVDANGHTSGATTTKPNSASIEDWFYEIDRDSLEPDEERIDIDRDGLSNAAKDLPRQLALIDIERELPKLSPLSHVTDKAVFSTSSDKFGTQAGVDKCFSVFSDELLISDTVDLALACWNNGSISTILQGDFLAGQLHSSTPVEASKTKVIAHASTFQSNKHVLLSQTTTASTTAPSLDSSGTVDLGLDVLTFEGITQSSYFLPFVIQKITSLKHLSDYITHTVISMRQAWSTAQDLPNRFIANVRESLSEGPRPTDLDAALYRLAVTGRSRVAVKDWLVNQLGERGHQRWDTALSTAYTHLLTLTHSHLLPALERLTVLTSRLRSLSGDPSVPLLPCSTIPDLTRLLSDISILHLIAHHILETASYESEQFTAFSAWLSAQILHCSAEPKSSAAKEAAEKAASSDFSLLLPYIQETLLSKSALNFFLAPSRSSASIVEQPRRPALQVRWAILEQILERHKRENVQPVGEKVELVNVLHQALFLRDNVEGICATVPEAFEKATDVVSGVRVCESVKAGLADVCYDGEMALVAAVAPRPDGADSILITTLPVTSLSSDMATTFHHPTNNTKSNIHLPLRTEVLDLKLPCPRELFVLAKKDSRTKLLFTSLPATSTSSFRGASEALQQWQTLQTWDAASTDFAPTSFTARHGRKGKKSINALVLAVDDKSQGFQVWDLDALRKRASGEEVR